MPQSPSFQQYDYVGSLFICHTLFMQAYYNLLQNWNTDKTQFYELIKLENNYATKFFGQTSQNELHVWIIKKIFLIIKPKNTRIGTFSVIQSNIWTNIAAFFRSNPSIHPQLCAVNRKNNNRYNFEVRK